MTVIRRSVEVAIPAHAAYEEWTRFEHLDRFLPGVREVRLIGDDRLYWDAEVAGIEREWEFEITENIADRRLAWRTLVGPRTWGNMLFQPLGPERCRVLVEMEHDPQGFVALVSDYLGVADRWVGRSLETFRSLMEDAEKSFAKLPPEELLVGQ
jgi:uncharacterized membrane protein